MPAKHIRRPPGARRVRTLPLDLGKGAAPWEGTGVFSARSLPPRPARSLRHCAQEASRSRNSAQMRATKTRSLPPRAAHSLRHCAHEASRSAHSLRHSAPMRPPAQSITEGSATMALASKSAAPRGGSEACWTTIPEPPGSLQMVSAPAADPAQLPRFSKPKSQKSASRSHPESMLDFCLDFVPVSVRTLYFLPPQNGAIGALSPLLSSPGAPLKLWVLC